MKPNPHDRLLAPLATIPACQKPNQEANWFPPVDILEDAEEYLFRIDLPGVKVEDLRLAVEGDGLVISGVRPNPWQDAGKYLRVERPYGYFERRFALPDDVSTGEISTFFSDCVLEVRARKTTAKLKTLVPSNATPRLRLQAAA